MGGLASWLLKGLLEGPQVGVGGVAGLRMRLSRQCSRLEHAVRQDSAMHRKISESAAETAS
jgi:hypothetical protein